MTSAASGPRPIRARSVEPVLHLQPRYPVEIPPVAGDEGEVLRKRHPGQPDVLQSKVLPAANQSLEVDLAVRSGKPAESADFLQGGEEGIVCLDGIGRVIGCVGKGFRSMENSPQSILDECAQRLPIPAGLSLRQLQESLINIQDRLHDVKLGRAGVAVNAEPGAPLTFDTGFRRFSVQRFVPRQCREDFGGVASQATQCDIKATPKRIDSQGIATPEPP